MDNNINEVPYHLYLGCEVRRIGADFLEYEDAILVGVCKSEVEPGKMIAIVDTKGNGKNFQEWYFDEIYPLLRRLSSMSKEDKREIFPNCDTSFFTPSEDYEYTPEETVKMFAKGFWLFSPDAFDKGVIIDKDTVK